MSYWPLLPKAKSLAGCRLTKSFSPAFFLAITSKSTIPNENISAGVLYSCKCNKCNKVQEVIRSFLSRGEGGDGVGEWIDGSPFTHLVQHELRRHVFVGATNCHPLIAQISHLVL